MRVFFSLSANFFPILSSVTISTERSGRITWKANGKKFGRNKNGWCVHTHLILRLLVTVKHWLCVRVFVFYLFKSASSSALSSSHVFSVFGVFEFSLSSRVECFSPSVHKTSQFPLYSSSLPPIPVIRCLLFFFFLRFCRSPTHYSCTCAFLLGRRKSWANYLTHFK